MLNDAYSHDISKKTRCALTTKRQNGDYVGACTIYGYQKDEDNKNRLAIDETTARTVQDIFRMKINGISAKKIADELNRLGVLSPIEYKKSKGLPHPTGGFADKEGAKWSVTTIVKQLNDRNILPPSQYAAKIGKITNENLIGSGKWQTRTVAKLLATDLFTGDMVQGKMKTIDHTQYPVDEKGWIVVRSTHEPIVSREMFDAVKAYREQVADKCVQKEKIHFTDNLLKGKIFCDCCKKNIHRQRCHENYVFHCISNSRIAKGTCTGVTVREDELFEAIMCVIRKEADTLLDKNRGLQKKSPELDAKRKAAIEQIAAFKQDIDKNQGYLKGLYENLSRGIISLADYTRFISVNDSFDSADYKGDTGGLDVAFKYLIGEYYSMDLSKKSKTAKYAKMKRGEYQSKICCYGYKKGGNGRLEIDEEVAQTVKLIFDLSLQGCNAQQIVEVLYEKGISTPGEYKVSRGNKTHDVSRCHHIWPRSTVLRMLVDERYIGTYVMGKRTLKEIGGHRSRLKDESEWFKIPNHHPAIIDKAVFERVQAQLPHFKSEKKHFAEYPLRSKVFCGCCGHGMARRRTSPIFTCDFTRIDDSFDCHGLQIAESALETILFEIISKQAQVILNMDSLADTHDLQTQRTEKSWCGKQIAEYEEHKQRLYEAYCRKEIELAVFTERKAECDAELSKLKEAFATLSMQTIQAQKSGAQRAEMRVLAETIAGESRLSSALTDALLDKVVVYPNKQLEIVWKLKDFCAS